jgi:hypothetical protein
MHVGMADRVFRAQRARVFWMSAVIPAVVGAILIAAIRDTFVRGLGAISVIGGLGLTLMMGLNKAPILRVSDEGLEFRRRRYAWSELTIGDLGLRRRGRLGPFEAFTIQAPGRAIEIEGLMWPDVREIHATVTRHKSGASS